MNMKKQDFNFPLGNIKKIWILGLVLIFMIQLVNAAEVCVVAYYGDEGSDTVDSKCVDIDEGKSGYDLLEELGWTLLWSPESAYGRMICKINDVGTDVSGQYCAYSGDFWNLVLNKDNGWLHMPVGLDAPGGCWNNDVNSWDGHYCTKEGDVVGLVFGAAGAEPKMFTVNISKIYVDGDKQRESRTRRGKIVDVFPESVVKFKIELENLYQHSTDIEVTDISIEGTIEDISDGDDIDEELSEFDLRADKKITKNLEFTIPLEVEAKDRLVRIDIKAEDDAGIKYEAEFTFDLEVEKENHDVRITNIGLNKDSYKCGTNALLSVSLLNIGEKEEDVNLQIVNYYLKLDINEDVELSDDVFEESSKFEKRFNIWLPDDAGEGTYAVMINADYSGEKKTQNVDLLVSDCEGVVKAETKAPEIKESEEVTGVQTGDSSEDDETEPELTQVTEGTTTLESVGGNMPLILGGLLVVLVVIIFALGIGFLVVRK